ncbi:MAG: ComF family protein [Elusimicrobia bacterium CG_4_9_14_3_um_filter_62_55]|nr:MAG: ComF family protein [Elusimicrobia bacterium CG_4_9_14_3_um_filter_62_55]
MLKEVNLLNLLLPDSCGGCAADVSPAGFPLCAECRSLARKLESPPLPKPQEGPLRLIRAAYRYAPPLPNALHANKYDSRQRVGVGLGALMAARWRLYPELGIPHALVPVPLHPRKQRIRGFNQAHILAEGVGRRTGLPVLTLLHRRTNDPPQARLPRESRKGRLGLAFEAATPHLRGARLILIDDVATSGETLRACAIALTRAGAEDIRAYVLAMGTT